MTTASAPGKVADNADHRWRRYQLHAEICKVLTDPKRVMLIELLQGSPRSVGELAAAAGLTLANTSQHLAVLRHGGLVSTDRRGTTIRYALSVPELIEACRLVDAIVARRVEAAGLRG